MERKVYSGWAFTKNEDEKSKINREIYNEIKDKATFKYSKHQTYGTNTYEFISMTEELTNDELALICDDGNLCFGYRKEGNMFKIYID